MRFHNCDVGYLLRSFQNFQVPGNMKIAIILLAIAVSRAVAFPSGLLDNFLGGLFNGDGSKQNHGDDCHHRTDHHKHEAVCSNALFSTAPLHYI